MNRAVTPAPGLESVKHQELNRIIHGYGESIRHFFRDQQRSSMISPLFNIPGRMVLGAYCYYEHLPALLRQVTADASAEEIAGGMKRPCNLPNYISLNSLMIGYLNGREQSRLLGKRIDDDIDGMAEVLEFWSHAASAYRSDGEWLPDSAGYTLPILSQAEVQAFVAQLEPRSASYHQAVRKMMATLELFTFILNGESRIGVFHHGPYPLPGGDFLVFKEFVGLQEDYYSWATPDVRLAYPSIARVLRLRDVKIKIVLMGSMTTEPKSYEDNIVAEALFVREHGVIHPLADSEIGSLTQAAGEAQLQLYRQMADWDDLYRVAYGAELYGCILSTFAPCGRREAFRAAVRSVFQDSIHKHAKPLANGEEPALVLQHIATTDGAIYAPLRCGGAQA